MLDKNHSFNIRPCDITKAAGLAKSSFYLHYRSVADLIETNEQRILSAVSKIIETEGFCSLSIETKWRNILIELYKHRVFLGIMMKARNIELSEMILDCIEKSVIICSQNQSIMNPYLLKLTKECIITELDLWKDEGFSIDEISAHAHRLAGIAACAPRIFWQISG